MSQAGALVRLRPAQSSGFWMKAAGWKAGGLAGALPGALGGAWMFCGDVVRRNGQLLHGFSLLKPSELCSDSYSLERGCVIRA